MRRRPLAKITRPRLHEAVPRERLFSLLDDARQRAVTWIAGPPGAGKTTLAASWLEHREIPAFWYQVDSGDGDPGTFFHYLSLAGHVARTKLPELTPESLARPLVLARLFFRAWFADLPENAVVVFDNYQEAHAESALHAVAAMAAEEIPEGVHVVFISRAEPPGPFARLAASRQLTLMDWHVLRLTLDETRRMTEAHFPLDTGTVRSLHERSDGWAAGVTLMLERLRRNGILPAGAEAETREAVFTYFAGVMFDRLDADARAVLLSVALLPHSSLETAKEISASPTAGKVLDQLYRNHLFTERQAGAGFVYRFHPLFRAFLLERGPEHFGAAAWEARMGRAARLLESTEQTDAAFALYVQLAAWPEAGRLVAQEAATLIAHGRGLTVLEWIGQMPPAYVETQPWCLLWRGVALSPSDPASARARIEQAFRMFESAGDRRGMLLVVPQMLSAIAWGWSDYASVNAWVEVADRLLAAPPENAALSDLLAGYRGFIHGAILGDASHSRLLERAEQLMNLLERGDFGAHDRLEAALSLSMVLHFSPNRALLGRLGIANAATLAEGQPYGFRWIDCAAAYAHALQRDGAHEAALAYVDAAIRRAAEYTSQRRVRWFHLVRCLIFLAQGKLAELRAALAEFLANLGSSGDLGPQHFRTQIQAVLELADGRFESAFEYAAESVRLADESCFAYIRVRTRPLLAVTLAHCGRFAAAREVIAEGERIAAPTVFWYASIEFKLARAYVHLLAGDTEVAHGMLRAALAQARERDDTWDFLDICAPFVRSRLYAEALHHAIEPELVRAIIRRHRIAPGAEAGASWPWLLRIRTTGTFEVTVDGQPLAWGRKAPRKMMALLQVLVENGGANVPESVLTDTLWPDEDGDVAHSRYGVTLLRLRRLLGDATLLRQESGCLSLDMSRTWIEAGQPDHTEERQVTSARSNAERR